MNRWLPATLFGCLLIALLAAMTPDISRLYKLYADKSIRRTVRIDMNQISAKTGWLLSDLSLLSVEENTVTFLLRHHVRGGDPAGRCFILYFPTSQVHPCNEG